MRVALDRTNCAGGTAHNIEDFAACWSPCGRLLWLNEHAFDVSRARCGGKCMSLDRTCEGCNKDNKEDAGNGADALVKNSGFKTCQLRRVAMEEDVCKGRAAGHQGRRANDGNMIRQMMCTLIASGVADINGGPGGHAAEIAGVCCPGMQDSTLLASRGCTIKDSSGAGRELMVVHVTKSDALEWVFHVEELGGGGELEKLHHEDVGTGIVVTAAQPLANVLAGAMMSAHEMAQDMDDAADAQAALVGLATASVPGPGTAWSQGWDGLTLDIVSKTKKSDLLKLPGVGDAVAKTGKSSVEAVRARVAGISLTKQEEARFQGRQPRHSFSKVPDTCLRDLIMEACATKITTDATFTQAEVGNFKPDNASKFARKQGAIKTDEHYDTNGTLKKEDLMEHNAHARDEKASAAAAAVTSKKKVSAEQSKSCANDVFGHGRKKMAETRFHHRRAARRRQRATLEDRTCRIHAQLEAEEETRVFLAGVADAIETQGTWGTKMDPATGHRHWWDLQTRKPTWLDLHATTSPDEDLAAADDDATATATATTTDAPVTPAATTPATPATATPTAPTAPPTTPKRSTPEHADTAWLLADEAFADACAAAHC